MRWNGRIGLIAVVAVAAGCSSAPLGRSVEQELRVEVPGCPPMRCELRNDLGQWVVAATPGPVTVRTSARPLEVSCRRPDQPAGMARLPSAQPDPTDGGAAAGAAVGAGVAAAAAAPAFALGGPFGFLGATLVVIGAVGGAGAGRAAEDASRPFAYPSLIQVEMACPGPPPDAAALAAARWGLAVRSAQPGDGAPAGAVWVSAVDPGGRAAAAGLRPGDLLLAVDGRPLAGTLELEDALQRARREAAAVTLSLRRGDTLTSLVLGAEGRP